jgi:hypothetical protein
MPENTSDELFIATEGVIPGLFGAARVEKALPSAYRLVRFRTDEGQVHLKLQGYFTWQQGWAQHGGEWKDIETVDADELSDDKPYGQLS